MGDAVGTRAVSAVRQGIRARIEPGRLRTSNATLARTGSRSLPRVARTGGRGVRRLSQRAWTSLGGQRPFATGTPAGRSGLVSRMREAKDLHWVVAGKARIAWTAVNGVLAEKIVQTFGRNRATDQLIPEAHRIAER